MNDKGAIGRSTATKIRDGKIVTPNSYFKLMKWLEKEKPEVYKEAMEHILEGGNLAASKIRNLECPSYEICLIDYGCGKFNRKIHIMEQYP